MGKIYFYKFKNVYKPCFQVSNLHCIAIFPLRMDNMLFLYFVLNVKQGIISNWTLFTFLRAASSGTTQCFYGDLCAIYHLSEPKSQLEAGQCFSGFVQIHAVQEKTENCQALKYWCLFKHHYAGISWPSGHTFSWTGQVCVADSWLV